jgi:hypothetical protein
MFHTQRDCDERGRLYTKRMESLLAFVSDRRAKFGAVFCAHFTNKLMCINIYCFLLLRNFLLFRNDRKKNMIAIKVTALKFNILNKSS